MTCSRVDDQARRLINDDQMLILEDDLQRDRLRNALAARLDQGVDLHLLGTLHTVLRPWLAAIDQDPTLLHPGLQAAP